MCNKRKMRKIIFIKYDKVPQIIICIRKDHVIKNYLYSIWRCTKKNLLVFDRTMCNKRKMKKIISI